MALTTDREKCAHLLRRFGLGASEAELTYYLRDGLNGAIDRLLAYKDVEEGFPVPIEAMARDGKQVNMPGLVTWWTLRLLATRRPLQERMTLFWHDHFATSASKVKGARTMHAQNEVLRGNATGSFHTLLAEASKDPAMLYWLDAQENVAGKPNENFAREVMELFTLGEGHYTEKDVQEAARAFTGWSVQRRRAGPGRAQLQFAFRPRLHDSGTKTILGKTGELSGEDVLTYLCEMPRTAEYLVTKLWEWYAYPKPEPALVARLAKGFRNANLDVASLLKAMMRSSEFYSEKAERAVVKNPVDFCVVTLRQLGVGEALMDLAREGQPTAGRYGAAGAAAQTMRSMGMHLFHPPDVAGWDGGQAWITSATMVERMGWADRLFGPGAPKKPSIRYPAFELFQANPTPEGVADRLVSIFDASLPKAKRAGLVATAQKTSGGQITRQNAGPTAAAVSRLIFASPEFQFA